MIGNLLRMKPLRKERKKYLSHCCAVIQSLLSDLILDLHGSDLVPLKHESNDCTYDLVIIAQVNHVLRLNFGCLLPVE